MIEKYPLCESCGRDHSQDVGEEIFGNGDFSHLKRDITAIRGHVFCFLSGPRDANPSLDLQTFEPNSRERCILITINSTIFVTLRNVMDRRGVNCAGERD